MSLGARRGKTNNNEHYVLSRPSSKMVVGVGVGGGGVGRRQSPLAKEHTHTHTHTPSSHVDYGGVCVVCVVVRLVGRGRAGHDLIG